MTEVLKFYDEEYYLGHYGRIFASPDYYQKISNFWKHNIFDTNGLTQQGRILDFGSGLGQVSSAVNAECFDPSVAAQKFLRDRGRIVYETVNEIPVNEYQYLLSSHSLEHSLEPNVEVALFNKLLKKNGSLILLLPLEKMPGRPVFENDDNKHFYCWNFQTITNLLLESGFKVQQQKISYGPFGLTKLANLNLVQQLGKLKRNAPSILTIASKS